MMGSSVMNRSERALSLFQDGYSCSQSILQSFGPHYGLPPEIAASIGAPFGGGIARRGETCGAVLGAIMVLGLKFGHTLVEDTDSKEQTYQSVQQFISQFQEQFSTIQCNQLLDHDISTPQGLASAYEAQVFTTRCPKFVFASAEILSHLLDQAESDPTLNA